MDSMMPASVALNMPSTAAEVTVGSPHWPARGTAGHGWGHTGATLLPRLHQVPTSPRTKGYRGARALTGVGDTEPGGHGQDLPAGVCPGLVSVLLGPAGEDSGAGQHVADQPHQHDGQDDLRGTHRLPSAPLPSPPEGKGGNLGPPRDALSQSLPGTS